MCIRDSVFCGPTGTFIHPDTMSSWFKKLVREIDVPEIRLHDLRHTHATHLLANGIGSKVVSERLGHFSAAFTLDTYGHVLPGQQAQAAEAAASLLVNKVSWDAINAGPSQST